MSVMGQYNYDGKRPGWEEGGVAGWGWGGVCGGGGVSGVELSSAGGGGGGGGGEGGARLRVSAPGWHRLRFCNRDKSDERYGLKRRDVKIKQRLELAVVLFAENTELTKSVICVRLKCKNYLTSWRKLLAKRPVFATETKVKRNTNSGLNRRDVQIKECSELAVEYRRRRNLVPFC